MTAPDRSVKELAQDRLKAGLLSDDDAECEVQWTACADELARQLQVGARVDEHPGVLLAESEQPELVEAPADDALVLERELTEGRWELGGGHVPP